MKILAVGDIHTKLWIIESVKELVGQYDKIVFVGDYADDWGTGPQDSVNTWAALKSFQEENPYKVKLVKGNHDYIYVVKTPTLQSGYNQLTQLLINSPENKELKSWLGQLPIKLEIDGVTFSHAGITDMWNGELGVYDLWDDDSPIWARPGNEKYKDITQVFGHTPSKTCWEVQPNVWCIDTFSTYPNHTPIGDETALEIVDGKTFNKVKLEKKK